MNEWIPADTHTHTVHHLWQDQIGSYYSCCTTQKSLTHTSFQTDMCPHNQSQNKTTVKLIQQYLPTPCTPTRRSHTSVLAYQFSKTGLEDQHCHRVHQRPRWDVWRVESLLLSCDLILFLTVALSACTHESFPSDLYPCLYQFTKSQI